MHRIDKPAGSHLGFSDGIQVAVLQELLSDDEIELVCRRLGHRWRDRIFTPAVTVRSMVHRALSPDKSIRAVLTDLAVAEGRLKHTPAGASWCEARSRLPGDLWAELLQHSVKRLEDLTSGQFLYKSRRVFLIDGSTLSMPDTPELVKHFGYSRNSRSVSPTSSSRRERPLATISGGSGLIWRHLNARSTTIHHCPSVCVCA